MTLESRFRLGKCAFERLSAKIRRLKSEVEAYCPGCRRAVEAVCPDCRHGVEASGASTDGAAASAYSRPEFYRRFLLMIQGARNLKFFLGCYLLATGDAFADGVTVGDFAGNWGVKPKSVRRACRLIVAHLGLPPRRLVN